MITVKTILGAVKAATTKLADDFEFTGVTTNSRSVAMGDLFVALKGENFDGHDYCVAALAAGAAGVLVEKDMDLSTDKMILVDDTLAAYQKIAHAYRKGFKDLKVVAVTGSNGKTSTKDLIAACLSKEFNVIKTEANFNNEIGLPKTLLSIKQDTDIAVVELGMRGRGQIRALKAIAEPNVVVITNVGETHMELLGSIDNIAKAKSEILENLTPENTAVLNGDDYYISQMKTGAKIVTYGIITDNIVAGCDIKISATGTSFLYKNKITDNSARITLPLIGEHNVMNALAAIAVAESFNISEKNIVEALNNATLTGKRQEILRFGSIIAINDAYNASPNSMEAAFKTLEHLVGTLENRRGVAVLADMLELGENSKEAHIKVAHMVAKAKTELLITYGTQAIYISNEAAKLGVRSIHCNDRNEAAFVLKNSIEDKDVILFKGSHSMEVDKVMESVFSK